jgi:hypothetical protein
MKFPEVSRATWQAPMDKMTKTKDRLLVVRIYQSNFLHWLPWINFDLDT